MTNLTKTMNALSSSIAKQAKENPVATISASHIVKRSFLFQDREGLTCMAAALIATSLAPYDCSVTVTSNGASADGKSIMGLLSMAAGYGTKISFDFNGANSAEALAALQNLFETQFSGPRGRWVVALPA
jgi:phosphocarrier protein